MIDLDINLKTVIAIFAYTNLAFLFLNMLSYLIIWDIVKRFKNELSGSKKDE